MRVRNIIQQRLVSDIKLFMREYWDWKNLRNNLLGFSLALSALASAVAAAIVRAKFPDRSIIDAFAQYPARTILILGACAGLIAYSGYRVIEQKKSLEKLARGLEALRLFRIYKGTLGLAQSLPFMQQGAGAFVSFGIEAVKHLSDSAMNHAIEKGTRNEMIEFALITAAEYSGRIIILLLAVSIL